MNALRNVLCGSNVLLIAPKYFDIERSIQAGLENYGANVRYLEDRPTSNPLFKFLIRLFPLVLPKIFTNYYLSCVGQLDLKFDYLLVICGQTISREFLKKFSEIQTNTIKILYLWDSPNNRPNTIHISKFFDKRFSFESDCHLYNFEFRPLFYNDLDSFDDITSEKKLYTFIGTIHTDRHEVLERIKNETRDRQHFHYRFLQSRLVYWFKKYITREWKMVDEGIFSYVPLGKDEYNEIMCRTKCIIDIEHVRQSGLTIRTFDIFKYRKQLITTNQSIVSYDFYDSRFIQVIDRNSPSFNSEFLENDSPPVFSEEYYVKYSLSGWLYDLFVLSIRV